MLTPIIPRSLQPVFQIGPATYDTDLATNALAQPPICGHDIEDSFSWLLFPHPVVSHEGYNSSLESILGPVAPRNPYPHKDVPSVHSSPWAARLPDGPKSIPVGLHHVAVPRSRLTTAGFHSRRRADFAWSHFFPLSVGFAPTASSAKGAFTIAPSMLCHDQAMPSISSYSASPLRQRCPNTLWRFHSKKYLWMELELPNSFSGNAFHWHPVRKTKTIPANTLRGSMGLRPPPGRRRYFRFFTRFRLGISGSTRFHSSSETVHDLMALMTYIYHECFFNVNSYLRIST
jgi:hypothetical protein